MLPVNRFSFRGRLRLRNYLMAVSCLLASVVTACGGGGDEGAAPVDNGAVSITGRISSDGSIATARTGAIFQFELVERAYAQDSDLDGPPLVGGTVDLIGSDGLIVATTTTDSNGEFVFIGVLPGSYSIAVSSPEITTLTITEVVVLGGDITIISGQVTATGGVAAVDYRVGDCGTVAGNDAQTAHATALADAAGVSVESVIATREGSCEGWGRIAQDLGVPPGTLGLGNNGTRGGGRRGDDDDNDNEDDDRPGNGNGNSNANGGGNGNANGNSNSGN